MSVDTDPTAVRLPNGCAYQGRWLRDLRLRAWNTRDLEATAQPSSTEARSVAQRTTAILARCVTLNDGQAVDEEFVRNLVVGDREALLLHLQRMSSGDRFSCVLTCPQCRDRMDFELELRTLLLPPYEHAQSSHLASIADGEGKSYEVQFRLPTGADQEFVAALALQDCAAAARVLLERCIEVIDNGATTGVPDAVTAGLPNLMAKLDPQAELILHVHCPSCETQFDTQFDASRVVHATMDQALLLLLRDVHRLASYYHWTEAEILALSAEKRRIYCDLISQEQSDHQREPRREPRRDYHVRGLA
ncbi:MAG TPA: hypothetical protein VIV60_12390 [Polyangiaceae bacterium]